MNLNKILVSASVVSHRQIQLVNLLMADIQQYCTDISIEIILTVNVEEHLPFGANDFVFPIRVVKNIKPKGFGENHNAAFKLATGKYFCVLNPDIRLYDNPFPTLIKNICNTNVGLIAPRIVNNEGVMEDSARRFPSPREIVRKVFGGKSAVYEGEQVNLSSPDWVAGMFMLFPRESFQRIRGFDERYFLYYEDVDLCVRLTLESYKVLLCPTVSVIHNAQRSSHKNFRYLRLHLTSMLRFFFSDAYRRLRQSSISKGVGN